MGVAVRNCQAGGDDWSCDRSSDRFRFRRGLCTAHYAQRLKGKCMTPIAPGRARREGRVCEFAGCIGPARSGGLCTGHYQQSKKGRTPNRSDCADERQATAGEHAGHLRLLPARRAGQGMGCRPGAVPHGGSGLRRPGARGPRCLHAGQAPAQLPAPLLPAARSDGPRDGLVLLAPGRTRRPGPGGILAVADQLAGQGGGRPPGPARLADATHTA